MEDQFNSSEKLEVTDFIKLDLVEGAKWAKFLAIVGFVSIGLMLVGGLFVGSSMSALSGATGAMSGALLVALYFLIAGLYFYPVYALYKFAKNIKLAIEHNNNNAFATGIRYLKGMFKYMGIITVIFLSLYALLFMFGILGAAMR